MENLNLSCSYLITAVQCIMNNAMGSKSLKSHILILLWFQFQIPVTAKKIQEKLEIQTSS